MGKINLYLFNLTNKYILINFIIISVLILFVNFIELSRILPQDKKSLFNFLYLSFLKFPSILNEIIPFVAIISIAFLTRNLVNNNELISMRNIGYSIFDIFTPIALSIFLIGVFFLFIINPLAATLESKYDKFLNQNQNGLYSIKITKKQMWIKNEIDSKNYSFINIKDINLKDMRAKKINILLINDLAKKFIRAETGKFQDNSFLLNNVHYYDFKNEYYENLDNLNLSINFNEENLINSLSKYKLIPFYKYLDHSKTLSKFNLYSSEIGLFYLSEVLKPIFIVMLSFVVIGFSGKFKRNENFYKVLFLSITIGFIIFLFKEIITKITISYSINFILSYFLIFTIPFLVGLYQIIKIEND